MYKMDTFSSITFYSVLLLCYDFAQSINTDSRDQNFSNKSQNVNVALSTAERVRRLVPYVTYYVVGNNDDDVNYQNQYKYQNTNPNINTPGPQPNNFYYQNERKPQQTPPTQNQHTLQISNQLPQQHSTPVYLRFPSSPKIRRPVVVSTTEIPYTIQTEKTYNYYYDYIQTSPRPILQSSPRPILQSSPRPIFQTSPKTNLQPNPVEYNYGFLPTIPTIPPTHYSVPEQEIFSTKTKKLRRPKPKKPTTPTTTTTDKYGALNDLLNDYDLGNRLSNKITAENIGSSIQTLSAVLQILQNEADERVRPTKPKPIHRPDPIDDYDSNYDGNQGRPGVDYPILSVIPKTSFNCKTQRYKGFFGDPETHCQVWHYCDLNGGQASFLCPNGTIFNQVSLTCDWWFNVKCDTTTQLYVLNERLYKYIIPSKPSFPEDFEGPLVDKYLEDKFKEIEQKRSQQKETIPEMMNITTIEPDTVRTPYQQLLDVDT